MGVRAEGKDEDYPEKWVRVELMVSPTGECHAIGGDRELGEGDRAYIGLERIKLREALIENVKLADLDRWFDTSNESFDGLKPSRVGIDRLWEMIFRLRSGMPG